MTMKKMISLALAICMALALAAPVGAATVDSIEERVQVQDELVLNSMEDLKELSARDQEEYNSYIEAIDDGIKKDFNELVQVYPGIEKQDVNQIVDRLLVEYPEYKTSDMNELKDDIALLSNDMTVAAVRKFFTANNFQLSLALFDHSLTKNPAPATLSLVGNTDGMYGHIKSQLYKERNFFNSLVAFSRGGQNALRDPDWGYNFNDKSTDMYWSIHRCDVVRNRTAYNTVHFRIVDEYDFDPSTIAGVVAGACDTNPFHVEIYGVIQQGAWK